MYSSISEYSIYVRLYSAYSGNMHKANMFEVYIVPHILQKCTVSFGLFSVYGIPTVSFTMFSVYVTFYYAFEKKEAKISRYFFFNSLS
jgi:hypothetical protein